MPRIKWDKMFSQRFPVKGATEAELLALVSTISQPLSEQDIHAAMLRNQTRFLKQIRATLPTSPLTAGNGGSRQSPYLTLT